MLRVVHSLGNYRGTGKSYAEKKDTNSTPVLPLMLKWRTSPFRPFSSQMRYTVLEKVPVTAHYPYPAAAAEHLHRKKSFLLVLWEIFWQGVASFNDKWVATKDLRLSSRPSEYISPMPLLHVGGGGPNTGLDWKTGHRSKKRNERQGSICNTVAHVFSVWRPRMIPGWTAAIGLFTAMFRGLLRSVDQMRAQLSDGIVIFEAFVSSEGT